MENSNTYSEEELVLLLQNRDKAAFSYLYDNYAPALYNIIYRMVEDISLAEDVLQEAFVKIWNNFSTYDKSRGRLFTWMLNLARNLTIDMLRSKGFKNQRRISGDESIVNNLPDQSISTAKFDALGIRKHLAHLKPDQKVILDMAYFNGFTQEEIAKELAIPLGTVKTRMRTAILELRKMLQPT